MFTVMVCNLRARFLSPVAGLNSSYDYYHMIGAQAPKANSLLFT
jgi:hypothetical protein